MKRYLLVGFASVILIVVTIALPGRTPSAAQGQASSSTAVLGGAVGGVLGGTGPLTRMPSPPQKPAPKLGRVGSNLKAPRPTVQSLRQLNRILLEKSSDGAESRYARTSTMRRTSCELQIARRHNPLPSALILGSAQIKVNLAPNFVHVLVRPTRCVPQPKRPSEFLIQ